MATTRDEAFAAAVAAEAGRMLLSIRERLEHDNPVALRAEADRRSHELITSAIREHYPEDAWLSEEAPADDARLQAERVWIVDPLDGTREFAEDGRTDWAVHVALVIAGEPVVGAVALPARSLTLSTAHAPRLPPASGRRRLLVSRTRPAPMAVTLSQQLEAELVPMGSAGAKISAVVLGEAEMYVHAGGQYEWDSAAPIAVAAAAGLAVCRIDGSPLRYNQPNPWLPDLVVCRPELRGELLVALAGEGIA